MKKLTFLAVFLCHIVGYSYQITFGEIEKTGKGYSSILGRIDDAVFVYKVKYTGIQEIKILKYNPTTLSVVQEKVIEVKFREFSSMEIINDKIFVFVDETNKSENYQRLYYNVYDPKSLNLIKSNVEVAKFELNKGGLIKREGNFNIIKSDNESRFAAFYNMPFKRGEQERFGVSIFDDSFAKLEEHQFVIPVLDELLYLGVFHLANSGKFYLAAKEVTDKNMFGSPSAFRHHIYQVREGGELVDYSIELPEKFIYDYSFSTDDNDNLICSGFYGVGAGKGVGGGFYLKIDGESKASTTLKFKDFPDEFIMAGWSDKAVKKAEKNQEKGKGDPVLYNYDIRNLETTEDGGAVLMAEQFYIKVRTYTDSKGNTRTIYYYYYNDIIVLKMDAQGEFSWYTKIPKYQVSTNDGGFFSSYSFHQDKSHLYFLFNDNIKNYEDGNVVGGKTYATNFGSSKYNVTSLTTLNLETGEAQKEQVFGKVDLKTIAVPKVYSSDQQSNMLYIYSKIRTSDRLGLIDFNK